MIKVVVIDEKSPYLDQVKGLANASSATLGFFPAGAFTEHAARRQILVALDQENNFLGYLLYAINRKEMLAYIVHLCIEESRRRKGTATALFGALKKRTQDTYRGIRVRCRRDYRLGGFWSKLGFTAVAERRGRSKEGTRLTVWWFDHGHPTLFTYADEHRTRTKLKVAVDANVFFDLAEESNPESLALLADWIEVELCLTSEIFNEIDRNPDDNERERERAFANKFPLLPSPDDEFQKVFEDLRGLFPKHKDDRQISDLRQLARAAAAGIQFFVTRDRPLLSKAEQIYEDFGMRIMRPSDLIIHQDELIREAEYQPARLAARIRRERVQAGQSSFLEDTFRAPQEETKGKFRELLQPCLAKPHVFQTYIVQTLNQPLSLIAYGREREAELEVPVFRVLHDQLSPTLARYLILNAVLVSSREGRAMTRVTDPYLSDEVMDALRENGFMFTNNSWVKANLHMIGTSEELASSFAELSHRFSNVGQYFQELANLLKTARLSNDPQTLLNTERSLWPTKITEIDIPAFVVPIWPVWAMHLFDPHIASQDLFGPEPSLILNAENVYYRRANNLKLLSAPARILWYVSKRKGEYQGAMSIRACSYLDEVVVGKPKVLFSRFRRLGIYQWENVFELADNDLDKDIMAFRFSNTELFSNPISRDDLQRLWQKETGRRFHVQGPLRISNQQFFRLYQLGIETQ